MPIKTKNNNNSKKQTKKQKNNRQNRHSEIRLSGVAPFNNAEKNPKTIERTLFWWAIIKTRTLCKNVKTDPQEYLIRGSPYMRLLYGVPGRLRKDLFFLSRTTPVAGTSLSIDFHRNDLRTAIVRGDPHTGMLMKVI